MVGGGGWGWPLGKKLKGGKKNGGKLHKNGEKGMKNAGGRPPTRCPNT